MGPERQKCLIRRMASKQKKQIQPSGSLLQEPDSDGAKSGCGELISKDGYKTTPYKINDRPQGPIFPRSKRFNTVFRPAAKSGPGTYGAGGIPHAAMEEANRRPVTSIGSLDSGRHKSDRSMPLFGTDLAPGRYEYNSFTDELLSRQVSKRGPFDITTGPRDGRPKKKSELGPGHYEYTPFTDKLQKGTQKKHGKFGALKCNAKPGERIFYSTISQCPNSMANIGPGSYDISRPATSSFNRNAKPFNSGPERFNKHTDKYFKANPNECGVGRYDIRKYKPPRKGVTTALFNSKTERFLDPKSTKYFNERIRSKDTRFADQMDRSRASQSARL